MSEQMLEAVGKRIRDRRRSMGYTQEQIADMMDVSIQMVSNLERGNKSIRIDNLVKLCRILKVSTDYILTGNDFMLTTDSLSEKIAKLPNRQRKMIEMLVSYCLTESQELM